MNNPSQEEYEKEYEDQEGEYEETEAPTVSDSSETSTISDKSLIEPTALETPNLSRYQRTKNFGKKIAKVAYNSTFGELRNGRIPIADTGFRTIYRKLWNKEGRDVFDKKEGYYKLGGKRTRKAKKSSSKKRKTSRRRGTKRVIKKSSKRTRKH
jgi:hypothetical protein